MAKSKLIQTAAALEGRTSLLRNSWKRHGQGNDLISFLRAEVYASCHDYKAVNWLEGHAWWRWRPVGETVTTWSAGSPAVPVSALSEEWGGTLSPRSAINSCNCLEDELWCEWEHSSSIFTVVFNKDRLEEQLENQCFLWKWEYEKYVWSVSIAAWHIYLSVFNTVPITAHLHCLSHPADVQSNVLSRGNTEINYYRLYNIRTIMWASAWVPEAKAPSPASHYSRCVDRSDTHTAYKLDREIGGVPTDWLGTVEVVYCVWGWDGRNWFSFNNQLCDVDAYRPI